MFRNYLFVLGFVTLCAGCETPGNDSASFVERNDPAFGAERKGVLNIEPNHADWESLVSANASSITVDRGDNVYIVGDYDIGRRAGFMIRLTSNGERDKSCGNGFVSINFGSSYGFPAALDVHLDQGSNIYVAGIGNNGASIIKLKPDCTADSTWGSSGLWSTLYGAPNKIVRFAINPLNNSVYGILQTTAKGNMSIVKIRPDGLTDNTFGENGMVVPYSETSSRLGNIKCDSQGRFVVVGTATRIGLVNRLLVYRFDGQGSPDSTFGIDGRVVLDLKDTTTANDVAIQSDGKILVAGTLSSGFSAYGFVLRLNANGGLDDGFGDGGKAVLRFLNGWPNGIVSVKTHVDGRIVAGGTGVFPHEANGINTMQGLYQVFRMNRDGSLDASYGSGGKAAASIPPFGGEGVMLDMDSRERYLMTGSAYKGFGVARILP